MRPSSRRRRMLTYADVFSILQAAAEKARAAAQKQTIPPPARAPPPAAKTAAPATPARGLFGLGSQSAVAADAAAARKAEQDKTLAERKAALEQKKREQEQALAARKAEQEKIRAEQVLSLLALLVQKYQY